MANIPTYTQKVLPSGSSGQAIQEYKTLGPMTPIDIAAGETAAKVKLSGAIADVFEMALKVQQHNEVLVGELERNKFGLWAKQAVLDLQNQYQLEKAIPTEGNPGVFKAGTSVIYEEINNRIENYPGSDVMKKALRAHLEKDAESYINSLKTYENSQRITLSELNLKAAQEQAVNMSYEDGVAKIKTVVTDMYGGSKAVMDIALNRFSENYAKAYFKRMMNVDPNQAVIELSDPESKESKMLDPKDRPDYLHAAMIRSKQNEMLNNAAEKKLHDDEERAIGNLYMKRDYAGAYLVAQNSKFLSGDEKRTWANSINEKLKLGDNVSDVTRANEVVKINSMLSKELPPEEIRQYIVKTPYLKDQDKEQYLNKLEAKLSADEKEGRRVGYSRIKEIIIPKRSILNPIIETPQELQNVRKAQDALDEWIDTQKKNGKYPTSNEIRVKADGFANMYQMPLSEKVGDFEASARKMAEELRIFSAQKLEYGKIPEADRKRIEQALISQGYPASVKNILDVYRKNIATPETINMIP